jgi:hypothetical protein
MFPVGRGDGRTEVASGSMETCLFPIRQEGFKQLEALALEVTSLARSLLLRRA